MNATKRRCRTVPRTACVRCGGLWWHVGALGDVYHSCVNCGYVPERVHQDRELRAQLIAEARTAAMTKHGAGNPNFIPGLKSEALYQKMRQNGRDYRSRVRDGIATERDLASLRAVGGAASICPHGRRTC